MKLFKPLLLALSVTALLGCADNSTPLISGYDRYQTYIYSEPSLNQHLYLDRDMNNLVSKARIKPNTVQYNQVIQIIEHGVTTRQPICLKYKSRASDTIIGICN